MKYRREVVLNCYKKRYLVRFTELGDYETLEFEFETMLEADDKLTSMVKDARKNNTPFYAEITKRLIIISEE